MELHSYRTVTYVLWDLVVYDYFCSLNYKRFVWEGILWAKSYTEDKKQ